MLWHDIEIGQFTVYIYLDFTDTFINICKWNKKINLNSREQRGGGRSSCYTVSAHIKNTLYRAQINHDKWVAGTCVL